MCRNIQFFQIFKKGIHIQSTCSMVDGTVTSKASLRLSLNVSMQVISRRHSNVIKSFLSFVSHIMRLEKIPNLSH